MSTPLLSVDGLTSGYGSAAVLHDVSLQVDKARIVAVLGKNGMGKSTLLKTVMGFVRPMGGRITFDGRDVTGAAPNVMARAGMAHAPQEHTLFQDLTVEDNLRLYRAATGRDPDDLMREVWGAEWWGSTKTLDMHISWLRRKLGDDATDPRRITTVRGVGFRFETGTES